MTGAKTKNFRWGIIGTGRIAGIFAKGIGASRTGTLIAVGSRSRESAERFGQAHGLRHRHESYDALLNNPEVDAVYISTPHPFHAEWCIKAAEAGKHILCEKPLTLNHAEAMAVIEAARKHDVFLMEAFMYRCHPQTRRLVELIRSGSIGQVRTIDAVFSFHSAFNPEGRLFSNALGGGGILDVGCYAISAVRLVAGAAMGQDFAEPIVVQGAGHIGDVSRVDEYAVASLRFPGEILAQVATGVQLGRDQVLKIYGSEGSIEVDQPWIPSIDGEPTTIRIRKRGVAEPELIEVDPGGPLYALEADTVAENVERRQAVSPAMTWADSLGNMMALDLWRESIGLIYEAERPENNPPPVSRRALRIAVGSNMLYGSIPGLEKRISRMVMGVDNQRTLVHGAVIFDDFFERGGTCFDSAYIYAAGQCERVLGHWVKMRGLRDEVVLLTKGAHTPFCTPRDLSQQLEISLDRLQTDSTDIYMMHRDNLEVPVDEFIDVLDRHQREGRIGVFGVSNWSLERVELANAYARRTGKGEIKAISNNFSLARMVDSVWAGCISASDPASRVWIEERQIALFSWSSQARGFFTDRAHPEKMEDGEFVRCWYSADNFERKRRAEHLAAAKGVLPINIALAYVLGQPFPTFALIGPRTLEETRTSLPGMDVDLTDQEKRWLDLDDVQDSIFGAKL